MDFLVAAGAGENVALHFFDFTHPHAQNVRNGVLRVFEQSQGDLAHHPPVGHHAEPADLKSLPEALNQWDQHLDVSGIARPHLTAKGPAVIIEDHSDHHLVQVGAVVLAEPLLSDRLSSLALESDGSGVQEHQVQTGKEIAVAPKKRRSSTTSFVHLGAKGVACSWSSSSSPRKAMAR